MILTKSYFFPKCIVLVVAYFLMLAGAHGQGLQLKKEGGDASSSSHGNESGGWQTFALPEGKLEKGKKKTQADLKAENKGETQIQPLDALPKPVKEKKKTVVKKQPAKTPASSNVIRIISSTIDNSALVMANDIARLLDKGKSLRIVPIIGKGTAQSLKDIYYLKGVDIGIIQADVLRYYKKNKKLPDPDKFIRYIATLGSQEVHIIARRNIKSLQALEGRSINVGPIDGGNAITAQAIFQAHNIKINSVHMETRSALASLKTGAIDGVVIVGGKPDTNLLRDLATTTEFHLIDIGFNEELEKHYSPTVMINEDYPYLIGKNRVVSSISVDMVMAMYFWPKGTPRYSKVKLFTETLFNRMHDLRGPLFHPKWKEVRIDHDLKGWKRFLPAKEWLAKNKKHLKKYSGLPAKK